MHSPELLKGTLQTILLKVLKDHGKMYGYEITQRVKELSDARLLLTEGALYPTLHKLEADGLLKTDQVSVKGTEASPMAELRAPIASYCENRLTVTRKRDSPNKLVLFIVLLVFP